MKVAVLGAGFSGMLASYLLEKSGVEVTVYEKNDAIGGHCRTIIGKNDTTELGTTFSFTKEIKELLLTLKVDYTERFIYRNFLDEHYNKVEQLQREDAALLMTELEQLQMILNKYARSFATVNYSYIHEDLMVPLDVFLDKHKLKAIYQVLAPLLSSFGFGSVEDTQAYYAFKVFDVATINTFIRGEKLLFINEGTSELIRKLGENISDIRYSLEVINVEVLDRQVKVETAYGADYFDKVIVTSKLPKNVIKDYLFNQMMTKIDTNPFFTCAYEVTNKSLVTTYYKGNLGVPGKLQFFHSTRHQHQTTLVAYAYGQVEKDIVNNITAEIKKAGIDIKHLITVKQWYIFPHLKNENMTQFFYEDVIKHQKDVPIHLIGSLITHPSIANLYVSVRESVEAILEKA